jgi:hypothetical protein
MWGKFDVLREECNDDVDYLYWIDAGLLAIQLFPKRYNPHISDPDIWTNLEKEGDFSLLFNEAVLNKLSEESNRCFVTLLSTCPQDVYYNLNNQPVKTGNYPIAGFFGGKPTSVLEYCDYFDNAVKIFVEHNILCFEQTIMKYVTDIISIDKLHILSFDTHASGLTEQEFHYDFWDETKNLPKPIWRIFEEIKFSLK